MKRIIIALIVLVFTCDIFAQEVNLSSLKGSRWELSYPDYSVFRFTTFEFTNTQIKETVYYKTSKKTHIITNDFYLSNNKTNIFNKQMVGKCSHGKYIIHNTCESEAIVYEVIKVDEDKLLLKNRLGVVITLSKK